MELGEWVWGRIIENSDNRGSDNRGYIVLFSAFTVQGQTHQTDHM